MASHTRMLGITRTDNSGALSYFCHGEMIDEWPRMVAKLGLDGARAEVRRIFELSLERLEGFSAAVIADGSGEE